MGEMLYFDLFKKPRPIKVLSQSYKNQASHQENKKRGRQSFNGLLFYCIPYESQPIFLANSTLRPAFIMGNGQYRLLMLAAQPLHQYKSRLWLRIQPSWSGRRSSA